MTVRKILSARTAQPKVHEMLQALVEAAVFIGGADGQFGEQELEVFIDTMREVVGAAVGEDFIDSLASTSKLLDQARAARKSLSAQGVDAYLAALAPKFQGSFSRDGMVLAWRVVVADERVTDKEAAAFELLAKTLGVDVDEVQVLKQLASKGGLANAHSPAQLGELERNGWKRVPVEGLDDALEYVQPTGGTLRLELDANESALHVHVSGGPRLVCLFGERLPALLTVIDGLRNSLIAANVEEKLPALRAVCPELFVERDGRFTS